MNNNNNNSNINYGINSKSNNSDNNKITKISRAIIRTEITIVIIAIITIKAIK